MRECGVSPVVATIILIAITLSISISLASQVINLWVTSGSSEALQIGGEVVKVGSDVEVNVVVVNKAVLVFIIIRSVCVHCLKAYKVF